MNCTNAWMPNNLKIIKIQKVWLTKNLINKGSVRFSWIGYNSRWEISKSFNCLYKCGLTKAWFLNENAQNNCCSKIDYRHQSSQI